MPHPSDNQHWWRACYSPFKKMREIFVVCIRIKTKQVYYYYYYKILGNPTFWIKDLWYSPSIPVWYCVAVKLKKNNYLKIIFLYFNIKNNFILIYFFNKKYFKKLLLLYFKYYLIFFRSHQNIRKGS
jgi:hypothetical protein